MEPNRLETAAPFARGHGLGARSALVAGVIATAPVAWPQAPASPPGGAPVSRDSACQSAAAEEQMLARETALLGRAHAMEHQQTRREQCAARRGMRSAPARAASVSPQESLDEDQAVLRAAADLAQGKPTAAARSPSGSAANAAKRQGRWSAPFDIPVLGVASVLLHTGKVLYWSYDPATYHVPASSNIGVAYLWDPSTRIGRSIEPPENIWCGGQTLLSTGEVFVAGGNLRYPDPSAPAATSGWEGSLGTYTFDPVGERWITQPRMAGGRWYPTTTRLHDNSVIITSGYDQTGTERINNLLEVFRPSPVRGGIGTISTVANGNHDPSGLYPLQSMLPSGLVLSAGPAANGNFLLDPAAGSWRQLAASSNDRYLGNAISYTDASVAPSRQVVMIAGGIDSVAASGNQWMDGDNPDGGWQAFPKWQQGRFNANTIILADGSLLTVGGGQGPGLYDAPLFQAELYARPPTDRRGKWQAVAGPDLPAAYHSSALLLPDGTVLLSQDDRDTTAQHKAQVYSPPYLFNGPRIAITAGPDAVRYGTSFALTMDRSGASTALLVAPGATTHANDMHQRAVKVPVSVNGPTVTVTVPASGKILPPGYYMLFVVDTNGVPSVARFVHVS